MKPQSARKLYELHSRFMRTDTHHVTLPWDQLDSTIRDAWTRTYEAGCEDTSGASSLPMSEPAIVDLGVDGAYSRVLHWAAEVHREREEEGRSGVWRRSGVKGQVVMAFSKAERAFHEAMSGRLPDPDHFLDLINYAAFAIVLLEEIREAGDAATTERLFDGSWPWR